MLFISEAMFFVSILSSLVLNFRESGYIGRDVSKLDADKILEVQLHVRLYWMSIIFTLLGLIGLITTSVIVRALFPDLQTIRWLLFGLAGAFLSANLAGLGASLKIQRYG